MMKEQLQPEQQLLITAANKSRSRGVIFGSGDLRRRPIGSGEAWRGLYEHQFRVTSSTAQFSTAGLRSDVGFVRARGRLASSNQTRCILPFIAIQAKP